MTTVNLSNLSVEFSTKFVQWIIDNKIGNWSYILKQLVLYDDWDKRDLLFVCSDEEATFIALRWL